MTPHRTLLRRTALGLLAAALATGPITPAQAAAPSASLPGWQLKDTGSDARLRGLSAVSRDVAWASGSGGTVLRTTDGGGSWRSVGPPGTGELEFRDIEAFDARRAVALSIGEGGDSRVYRTDNGGESWRETFRNDDPKAFYDCLDFFAGGRHGLAMSDPVDGKYRILATDDGGRSWRVLPSDGMPPALEGEAGFAASGQCLVASGARDAWFATGGGKVGRVFHTADRGRTWSVTETSIPAGDPARGVFALAFRDAGHGLAVGGDYRPDQASPQAAARTRDAGANWTAAAEPPPAYRSGVAWLPRTRTMALAVGPTGTDITVDAGRTWHAFDDGSFDTVDCAQDRGCWAAGEKGRVARLG
ncbi:WD40/YVTN/BNR-like repeat-containing protein [Streptomyces boninensis]|uniref:WD40/YVTN/BNR-like repeat-containing protein n=1 Tax=Streptomyces boninensis TaxID=2039455 RepID=UPI003B21EA15